METEDKRIALLNYIMALNSSVDRLSKMGINIHLYFNTMGVNKIPAQALDDIDDEQFQYKLF